LRMILPTGSLADFHMPAVPANVPQANISWEDLVKGAANPLALRRGILFAA
jgi:hypothetical protein